MASSCDTLRTNKRPYTQTLTHTLSKQYEKEKKHNINDLLYKIDQQNKQIIKFEQKQKDYDHLSLQLKQTNIKNDELIEQNRLHKFDNQLYQQKLENNLILEQQKCQYLQNKNEELTNLLNKSKNDNKNLQNKFTTQKEADSEKIKRFLGELKTLEITNADLSRKIEEEMTVQINKLTYEIEDLRLQMKLCEEEKEYYKQTHMQTTLINKQTDIHTTSTNTHAHIHTHSLHNTTQTLNTQLPPPPPNLSQVESEREQYIHMKEKLRCLEKKFENTKFENNEETKKKIKNLEIKFIKNEVKNLQNYNEKHILQIQNLQHTNTHLQTLNNAWLHTTQKHIQEENATPEALDRYLFGLFTNIQALTHHKTTAQRTCEDMQLQYTNIEHQLTNTHTHIQTLNDNLQHTQTLLEHALSENEDLQQTITLLKLEKRGEVLLEIFESEEKLKFQNLKKKFEIFEQNFKKLQTQLYSQQQRNEELQNELNEISSLKYQINRLENEKTLIEKQNTEFHTTINKLNSKLSNKTNFQQTTENTTNYTSNNLESESIKELEAMLQINNEQKHMLIEQCEAIKKLYREEVMTYRQLVYSVLGWNITRERSNGTIYYKLKCLYTTHDGELIFTTNKHTCEHTYTFFGYDLYFTGYYKNKWIRDKAWKHILMSSQSFPPFMATTCLEELQTMKYKHVCDTTHNTPGEHLQHLSAST